MRAPAWIEAFNDSAALLAAEEDDPFLAAMLRAFAVIRRKTFPKLPPLLGYDVVISNYVPKGVIYSLPVMPNMKCGVITGLTP